jgi:psp operon transcriptional activator
MQEDIVSQSDDESGVTTMALNEAVWELKVKMMEQALTESKYHQKEAARRLGLTYHQFRGLYRQYRSKNDESGSD